MVFSLITFERSLSWAVARNHFFPPLTCLLATEVLSSLYHRRREGMGDRSFEALPTLLYLALSYYRGSELLQVARVGALIAAGYSLRRMLHKATAKIVTPHSNPNLELMERLLRKAKRGEKETILAPPAPFRMIEKPYERHLAAFIFHLERLGRLDEVVGRLARDDQEVIQKMRLERREQFIKCRSFLHVYLDPICSIATLESLPAADREAVEVLSFDVLTLREGSPPSLAYFRTMSQGNLPRVDYLAEVVPKCSPEEFIRAFKRATFGMLEGGSRGPLDFALIRFALSGEEIHHQVHAELLKTPIWESILEMSLRERSEALESLKGVPLKFVEGRITIDREAVQTMASREKYPFISLVNALFEHLSEPPLILSMEEQSLFEQSMRGSSPRYPMIKSSSFRKAVPPPLRSSSPLIVNETELASRMKSLLKKVWRGDSKPVLIGPLPYVLLRRGAIRDLAFYLFALSSLGHLDKVLLECDQHERELILEIERKQKELYDPLIRLLGSYNPADRNGFSEMESAFRIALKKIKKRDKKRFSDLFYDAFSIKIGGAPNRTDFPYPTPEELEPVNCVKGRMATRTDSEYAKEFQRLLPEVMSLDQGDRLALNQFLFSVVAQGDSCAHRIWRLLENNQLEGPLFRYLIEQGTPLFRAALTVPLWIVHGKVEIDRSKLKSFLKRRQSDPFIAELTHLVESFLPTPTAQKV